MIDVMAAELRGETIQFRGCSLDDAHDPWQIKSPTYRWDFVIYTYRIAKPEPKKVRVWMWVAKLRDSENATAFLAGPSPNFPCSDRYLNLGRCYWSEMEIEE